MTEQPEEPNKPHPFDAGAEEWRTQRDKGQSDQPKPKPKPQVPTSWWGGFSQQFASPPPPNYQPNYNFPPAPQPKTEDEKLADALAELLKPLAPTAPQPPVELSQERRAHVAQRTAEFKAWVAGGMTRAEALQLVGMEIQLHWRFNKGQGGS